MPNQDCKNIKDHINRLKGQLDALFRNIEENKSCKDIVHLALSSARSFDSLRAKIVETYIKSHFSNSNDEDLKNLIKLIKA